MYISSKLHDAMMKFGAYDFDNSSHFCVQFALDSSVHGLPAASLGILGIQAVSIPHRCQMFFTT